MTRRERELAERKELKRLYPTTPNAELAIHFNTTVAAIKNRAQRYGLKKSTDYVDKLGRSTGDRAIILNGSTTEDSEMNSTLKRRKEMKRLWNEMQYGINSWLRQLWQKT